MRTRLALFAGLTALLGTGCTASGGDDRDDLAATAPHDLFGADLAGADLAPGGKPDLAGAGTDLGLGPGVGAPFLPPAPTGDATFYVAPTGDDGNDGSQAHPWRSLQKAADTVASPGQIVDIAAGDYLPFVVDDRHGSLDMPIVFRGRSGVLLDGTTADRDAVYVTGSSNIVVYGIAVSDAPRSGFRVSNSFHVTIAACVAANNQVWGIFTDYSDDVWLLGNELYGSKEQHGIYHSNSGDRAIISGNYVHDNYASGIQINADPREQDPSAVPATRGDGISEDNVIERNLIVNNGQGGGGSINLASVRTTRIANNLVLDNLNTGIAMWDDGQDDPALIGKYGCRNNYVAHNSVVFKSGEGRAALGFSNTSTGNTFLDNFFIGGRRGAIVYSVDSLPGTSADYNVLGSIDDFDLVSEQDDVEPPSTLAMWQGRGYEAHSVVGIPSFVDSASGNYRLSAGSPGKGSATASTITDDYYGAAVPATGADIGACQP